MSDKIEILKEEVVLNKNFAVYGTAEKPLFLAKDVAEWLGNDATQLKKMLDRVDEEEKVRNNITTLGGVQNTWFLTEDGLYEVLMQSRKPIAKEFKKEVKRILKTIRATGGYVNNDDMFISTYLPFADDGTKALFKGILEKI